MISRLKTTARYRATDPGCQTEKFTLTLLRPRLWAVLLLLALPFIVVSWQYFESLERSGPSGALIADIGMPALVIGYAALVWNLKKRKL